MVHRVTTSDNEWQRVVQRVTTNDNEWQGVVQRVEWQEMVKRVTTNGNDWQRVTMNDNEWQRVTTNANEWQRVIQRVAKSDNEGHRVTMNGKERQRVRVAQQTHQPWINVEKKLIVNFHQRCFNVDIWLKVKVEPTYIYRRCFNVGKYNVETTLIELRRFNVEEPILFQRWNLVENENWADVCLSTLFQRWQNNVETTLT